MYAVTEHDIRKQSFVLALDTFLSEVPEEWYEPSNEEEINTLLAEIAPALEEGTAVAWEPFEYEDYEVMHNHIWSLYNYAFNVFSDLIFARNR